MNCRFCKNQLSDILIDLFNSPASNSFLTREQLNEPEVFYPLKVFICNKCFLVQIDEYKKSDSIFNNEYVYFSSFSKTWLEHSKAYTRMMVERFHLDKNSKVIEIASNDGYLLQYFKELDIPVLGIEPTANTAKVAIEKGIPTLVAFFGRQLARQLKEDGKSADLVLGNNVLAHVPDIIDFVGGLKIVLNPSGIVTMEIPHLMELIRNNQFDTIYHEHFSYLSFYTVRNIFRTLDLEIFDVDKLSTHGGSIRIYAKHSDDSSKEISNRVEALINEELEWGLTKMDTYLNFTQQAFTIKIDLLDFLLKCKSTGKKVAAYGAAAKGNTLLNYCGIKSDLIDFVVDRNPNKQHLYLPGSHIPVVDETHLKQSRPDYVLILPWNLKSEIIEQLKYIAEWNGKFVVPIPRLEIIND
ncbi:class I SAM-dependent methyltransferase [Flavihumibacter sp. RY-1]|uniref:Class I SAM-dependent methyltransferase n=1 Tax=Flavihumibacter fluminis TaxID=2909236 RepID=A0ABS9BDL3_9BACT|nr:class I SAM-dependent methyltransferase [Flavihumibacter fluminis]MCF1713208.1 class I SAM-dependent methyltransferase [Flavihumibacter fluminis]